MFNIGTETELSEFNRCLRESSVSILENNFTTLKIQYGDEIASVSISPEFLLRVEYSLKEIDKLIYGKNPLTNIVNISYKKNNIHIFRESNTFGIIEDVIPYKHWVLSSTSNSTTRKLNGNTHYKHIKEYDSESEYNEYKSSIWKYKLYNLSHFPEAFMVRYGFTYFKGMKPNEPSILSFDIETSGLNPSAKDAQVFLITNTFRKNGEIIRKTFNLKYYKSDSVMIDDWCDWVREVNPSILCGHNIVIYDLLYLNECSKNGLKLGRDDSYMEIEPRPRELRKDGSQSYSYNRKVIFGREVIDTFFLAIKFDIGRKYESYGLKNIIRQEGKEKPDRVFIDASKIKQYYYDKDETNWKLTVQYGEDDSDDSLVLFDLMATSIFYANQMIPKTFQIMTESATGSQLNALMVRGYIQDHYSVALADDSVPFEGAISLGIPGIYRNVQKWDVASLYPSIMLQYQIQHVKKDFNGNFQKILKFLREERLKNKKLAKDTGDRYYDDLQNTQKVQINSLYGFLGASGLNYNYPQGAAEVTRHGREILTLAIKWATGNDVSVYIKEKEVKVDE
jgi:DNA polymerase I